MHRFFVEPALLTTSPPLVTLPEKLAHQIRDVLRLTSGERIALLDNTGAEFVCAIVTITRSTVEVELLQQHNGRSESAVQIVLCQGMLKSARFEWILEKGTELGVATFAPIVCQRSTSGLEDAGPSKLQRWQRILQEAAEQCGRTRIPALLPIRPLAQALRDLPSEGLGLMPWEEERKYSLRDALRQAASTETTKRADITTIALFIGPEGGLTREEAHLAQQHGVQTVSLGPRILRAETAALAAVANVMYEFTSVGSP